MSILSHTLADLRDTVARAPAGQVEVAPLPPLFGEAFATAHPWRSVIDEMAPWGGYPAWSGVYHFFEWVTGAYAPHLVAEWDAAGDRGRAFGGEDYDMKRVVCLGRLVTEHGRDAVEQETLKYAHARLAAAKARQVAYETHKTIRRKIEDAANSAPDEATALAVGHTLWYVLKDLEKQAHDPEGYEDARDMRADAGLHSPPVSLMSDIAREIDFYEHRPETAVEFVLDLYRDKTVGSKLFVGASPVDCANGAFQMRFAAASDPWWVKGYDAAIARFGANATLAQIAHHSTEAE